MLVLVTAVGILLGLRLAYLRRQADFHAREADRFAHKTQTIGRTTWVWESDDWQMYSHHQRLAAEFRAALHRPWMLIAENMKTDDFDLDGRVDLLIQFGKP